MSFAILGLGVAVPPHRVTQEQALEVALKICRPGRGQQAVLSTLYRQSGISTRHFVVRAEEIADIVEGTDCSGSIFLPNGRPDDRGPTTGQRMQRYAAEAPELAYRAARTALDDSGLAPASLTHLITVSCTGFSAPGVDFHLIEQLGLSATVARTHIGFMGCHGVVNGLRVAEAFARADPGARIMLCAVELCSLHFQYGWDPKTLVGNALFADGAAAVVAAPMAGDWQIVSTGSCWFPDTADVMSWNIGEHGFEMMLSPRVPSAIGQHLRGCLEAWLGETGHVLSDIASWAVHPGGPRILTAVDAALALPAEATAISRDILAEYGNMSSPTVLFILERLRRQHAPRPCVALAFGPGLVVEAALFV